MYQQLSVLQAITEGFVHRIGPEQLSKDLPPKHEHVLLLCLDPAQQRMYKSYLEVSATHRDMLPGHQSVNQTTDQSRSQTTD